MEILLFIIGLSYLAYCVYLHQTEKAIFFYSYADIGISMINPVLIAIFYCLGQEEIISVEVMSKLMIISTIIVSIFIWRITYRANLHHVPYTIIMFFAKVVLSIILLSILILSVLVRIFYSTEREKYERKTKHIERVDKEAKIAFSIGIGIFALIISYCCYYNDFSLPEKDIELK
ncbi:hypothetical protein [Rodentibacter sp. Ppn85]|uniref:hypothetical protein n=1 Tax=Rodentibacter sp. Ppn85 TaxID=1908525 RepID=UPI0009855422|nr:hypothetical protein [Rodentibacter sp. Ppn85]OOF65419.1 hypothetical protein BKL51_05815 [Rodentibacter sp. Ppn85]